MKLQIYEAITINWVLLSDNFIPISKTFNRFLTSGRFLFIISLVTDHSGQDVYINRYKFRTTRTQDCVD